MSGERGGWDSIRSDDQRGHAHKPCGNVQSVVCGPVEDGRDAVHLLLLHRPATRFDR